MAKENAKAFLKKLAEEKELQEQLKFKKIDTLEDVARLAAAAKELGYEFTDEELLEAIREELPLASEELAKVYGGLEEGVAFTPTGIGIDIDDANKSKKIDEFFKG